MKYIRHNGQWVPAHFFRRPPSRFPAVISDHMDALKHPVTGQMIESKSEFRAITRAHGYVEMGNDAPRELKPYTPDPTIADDLNRSWQMVEQGYRPEKPADVPELADVPTRMLGET